MCNDQTNLTRSTDGDGECVFVRSRAQTETTQRTHLNIEEFQISQRRFGERHQLGFGGLHGAPGSSLRAAEWALSLRRLFFLEAARGKFMRMRFGHRGVTDELG